jgi:hypothetical protein
MNGQGSGGIGLRAEVTTATARAREEDAVEENAERFAQALLPHVAAPQPISVTALPTGGWRPSAEVLTHAPAEMRGALAPSMTETDASPSASDRVVLSVTSADLGELSLVLDRSPGGVRVLIGVADARSANLMLPEREALLARLVSSGVRVSSVRIVGQKELGTLLAPTRRDESSRTSVTPEPLASEDPRLRRRGSKKLDVIG